MRALGLRKKAPPPPPAPVPRPQPRPPVLRSASITMARNVQDIIEPFVRHHAGLIDLMVIMDNLSTDRTRDILEATARDLGNVVIADLPNRAYTQSQTMTQAFHAVQSAVFADFVFLLDADEFLGVTSREEMEMRLAAVPPGGMGLMPWQGWVPDPEMDPETHPDPLDRMRLRRIREVMPFSKVVLRPAGRLMQGLRIAQGNHAAAWADGTALPSVALDRLPLRHFPVRSAEQLLAKGVIGWQANRAVPGFDEATNQSFQLHRLHDIAVAGTRPDPARVAEEAAVYGEFPATSTVATNTVRDDHGIRTLRRHSDGSFARAEDLIRAAAGAAGPAGFALPDPPRDAVPGTDIPGAFKPEWHWSHVYLDGPLFQAVWARLRPESVLDVGCGKGLYLAYLRHLGAGRVLGVDGSPREATVLGPDDFLQRDLHDPFDLGQTFDLVTCLEVAEHLRAEGAAPLFASIDRHARGHVLFSMAEPGQPGNGHIAPLSMVEVLERWAALGWHPHLVPTLALRSVASMSWFRRNLLWLARQPDPGAVPALAEIAARPFVWYGQDTGYRKVAFREGERPAGQGYAVHPDL